MKIFGIYLLTALLALNLWSVCQVTAQSAPESPAGGEYLTLDGSDQYLYLPMQADFQQAFTTGLTIEGWFRFDHLPRTDDIWIPFSHLSEEGSIAILLSKLSSYLIAFRGPGIIREFIVMPCGENNWAVRRDCIIIGPDTIGFQYLWSSPQRATDGYKALQPPDLPNFPPQRWYHFAFVIGDKTHAVSIDGQQWKGGQAQTTNLPLTFESYPFYLGGRPGYPSMVGQLDEIRISSVPRSTRPPDAAFKPDGDTVALYHFDAPDPLRDDSGNGYHLRAKGFAGLAVSPGKKLAMTWAQVKRSR